MPPSGHDRQNLLERKVRNQRLSLEEFAARNLELKSRPAKITLELTQNCNLKCPMCSHSYFPPYPRYTPYGNMPLEMFDRIADELFADAHAVEFSGYGEPTVVPYWEEIVDRWQKYPLINWSLSTNLSLSRESVWEKMLRQGARIGFSCDAATKRKFEELRPGADFERIVGNLKYIQASIRARGRGHLYFIVTAQRRNIGELAKIVELARDHGVREVQLKRVMATPGNEAEDIPPEMEQALGREVARCLKIAEESELNLKLKDPKLYWGLEFERVRAVSSRALPQTDGDIGSELKEQLLLHSRVAVRRSCFKPFHQIYISWDAQVAPCDHLGNPGLTSMGSLRTHDFDEIWNGQEFQFFRQLVLRGVAVNHRCEWCFKNRDED